jgi:hypothetical protein
MADSEYSCPICGIERSERRVIQHLQVSHRKSTLSRRLLQGRDPDGEDHSSDDAREKPA